MTRTTEPASGGPATGQRWLARAAFGLLLAGLVVLVAVGGRDRPDPAGGRPRRGGGDPGRRVLVHRQTRRSPVDRPGRGGDRGRAGRGRLLPGERDRGGRASPSACWRWAGSPPGTPCGTRPEPWMPTDRRCAGTQAVHRDEPAVRRRKVVRFDLKPRPEALGAEVALLDGPGYVDVAAHGPGRGGRRRRPARGRRR